MRAASGSFCRIEREPHAPGRLGPVSGASSGAVLDFVLPGTRVVCRMRVCGDEGEMDRLGQCYLRSSPGTPVIRGHRDRVHVGPGIRSCCLRRETSQTLFAEARFSGDGGSRAQPRPLSSRWFKSTLHPSSIGMWLAARANNVALLPPGAPAARLWPPGATQLACFQQPRLPVRRLDGNATSSPAGRSSWSVNTLI